jgi:hypothetical protein
LTRKLSKHLTSGIGLHDGAGSIVPLLWNSGSKTVSSNGLVTTDDSGSGGSAGKRPGTSRSEHPTDETLSGIFGATP